MLALSGSALGVTDCLLCQRLIRSIAESHACEADPCASDPDLARLDHCHNRTSAVFEQMRRGGAALERGERGGRYGLPVGCEDARRVPVQTLCMKHGACMTRCEVCERMVSYWHANDCRGSPCTDLFGKEQKLKSSLDCWDALADMQRGGLLVEETTAQYDLQLSDCTQIAHTKRTCELWNMCP
jgi:hypothetical protein